MHWSSNRPNERLCGTSERGTLLRVLQRRITTSPATVPQRVMNHLRLPTRALWHACALSACGLTFAGTRYVDVTLTTGADDGSSWANAHRGTVGLVTALAAASPGDEIWVARGRYKPTTSGSRSISFVLRSDVAVYGGFAGGEGALSERDFVLHPTILSGDLGDNDGSGILTDNSFHVVNGASTTATAILDGFVVTGGNADAPGVNERGGGFVLVGASATIRNCIVRGNRAPFGDGGGMFVSGGAPRVESTTFEDNDAFRGGGSQIAAGASAVFERCIWFRNEANSGGGIHAGTANSVELQSCLFAGNVATGTTVEAGGGAVLNQSTLTIRGCTIVFNRTTGTSTGGIRSIGVCSASNSIVYDNVGASGMPDNTAGVTYSWSCVEGGALGAGILAADPQLAPDLGLSPGSPCIDAGNSNLVPSTALLDLVGNDRRIDDPATFDVGQGPAPLCDMGAIEFPGLPGIPFCLGDGSSIACPCANDGAPGNGCGNSSFAAGANLGASGARRISGDTLSLDATQMTGAVAIFLQGDATSPTLAIDDGLGCVGGALIRLGTSAVASHAARYPDLGDPSISVRGAIPAAGAQRFYQVVYRNAAGAFCPPALSNRTNGVRVFWVP